jgi:general stress protein 26/GNAT superfamily N-acetyltransferase
MGVRPPRRLAVIRRCADGERDAILAVVNAAAEAYRGVIPADRWHEPYMAAAELERELAAGVTFWGDDVDGVLVGVMAVQPVADVDLIRHAYVLPGDQGRGIGGTLLRHLRGLSSRRMLVGTWAAADWAIGFYERHGFTRVPPEGTVDLLRRYWTIPERQIETSVVLTSPPPGRPERRFGVRRVGKRPLRNPTERTAMTDAHEELWERIEKVRPTMMTTVERDGTLRSRPMWTLGDGFDGSLWFFTSDDAPKAEELAADPRVLLSYAAPDKDLFLSVWGRAAVVHDRTKAEELWNVYAEAWFPEGLDDPHLALLRVDVERAQYWEDRKPKVLQLAEFALGAVTGKRPESGDERKLDFGSS